MKACLVLQRRFAYLGHELGVLLKEKHGIDELCAYVHERDSFDFLRSQTDIPYTHLVLDEDIQKKYRAEKLDIEFLESFEREYGNLWSYISVDRVIRHGQLVREYPHDSSPYSYEEILRIVQVYAKELLAFIEKEKPDFIFAYQPGALGTLILYAIAQKKGIPTLTIVPTVTRNRNVVSLRFDRMTWVEQSFAENLKKKPTEISNYEVAKAYIKEFRERPVVYSAVYSSLVKHGIWRQFDFLSPRNIRRSLRSLRGLWHDWRTKKEKRDDYTTIHPLWYLYDRTKRKLRNMFGLSDLYDTFDKNVPFVFFPLHFEPELSILLLSPFDTNQKEMVKRLARSLPVGMYVYVKEHPQMAPFRPRRFYRELKKIPNVRLLRPEITGFDVIRESRLVAIITGAAGWEATLLGKPVITFGEVFYNALPTVAHSRTPDELPALVQKQISSKSDDETLTRFVAALFEDSAECDLLHLWEFEHDPRKKREGLRAFADLIGKKIPLVVARHHAR